MGQLVGVVEKQSTLPGVVRFELNRSLSGMGHERFASTVDAIGSTPSAALARQLFATGKVDSVHVYGNMVTVDIGKGYDSAGLADIVREMYRYWKPGVEPPVFEDAPAEEAEAAAGGEVVAATAVAAGEQLSEAAKRIPPATARTQSCGARQVEGQQPGLIAGAPGAANVCSITCRSGSTALIGLG